MDISVKCSFCENQLSFPAGRAGTKGKCTFCDQTIDIPQPPPPPAPADDDDEGPISYGLVDVVEEKKALPTEKKKEKAVLAAGLRRKKKLQDAPRWNVVRKGLAIMSVAATGSAIVYGLQMLLLLLATTHGPELNPARMRVLVNMPKQLADNDFPGPGNAGKLNRNRFALALVYSTQWLTYYQVFLMLLAAASLVPGVMFLMGYFPLRKCPRRFGMRGQVKALIILALLNLAISAVFKLVPLIPGVNMFTPMPYLVPEVPIMEANSERFLPLHITFMRVPFLEMAMTLLFICGKFAEFTLGGVFIYSAGIAIKDEETRDSGKGLVRLALGTAFAVICYHLATLAGCSDVLISVLRVTYIFGVVLQFILLINYMQILKRTRETMGRLMADMTEEELELDETDDEPEEDDDEDEEDEEDEEEEEDRKKKSKRRKKNEEDDEEEEEATPRKKRQRDEDDEEEGDDDRPRKKRKRDEDEEEEEEKPRKVKKKR